MLSAIVVDYASLGFMLITLFVIGALAFVAFGLNQAILLLKHLSISLGLFTALVNLVHFLANLSDPSAFLPDLMLSAQAVFYGVAIVMLLSPLSAYLARRSLASHTPQNELSKDDLIQNDQTQRASKTALWVSLSIIIVCLVKLGLNEPLLFVNIPALIALSLVILIGYFSWDTQTESNPTLALILSLHSSSVKGAGLMLGLSLTMVFYHSKQPQFAGPLFAVAVLSMCYAVVLQMFVKTQYVLANSDPLIKQDQTLIEFKQGQKTMMAFYIATLFCILKFFSLMAH